MENKKNLFNIVLKINKMRASKVYKKIKKGKNIIIFSNTIDGNLNLVQYFESNKIKNIDKNILKIYVDDYICYIFKYNIL